MFVLISVWYYFVASPSELNTVETSAYPQAFLGKMPVGTYPRKSEITVFNSEGDGGGRAGRAYPCYNP